MTRPVRLLLVAWAWLATTSAATAVVTPWQENAHSRVRITTPYLVAPAPAIFELGVEFELQPGWHAYWRNSGDAGFPPTFDLAQTPRLLSPRVSWPAPHRFEVAGGLQAFGYADHVLYPLSAEVRDTPSPLPIRLVADYLVCAAECVPYRLDLALDQPLGPHAIPDPETTAVLATWRSRVPQPGPHEHLEGRVTAKGDDYSLELRYRNPAASAGVGFVPDVSQDFEYGNPSISRDASGATITVSLVRKNKTIPLPAEPHFSWVFTDLPGGSAVEYGLSLALPQPREPWLQAGVLTSIALLLLGAALFALRRRSQRPLL